MSKEFEILVIRFLVAILTRIIYPHFGKYFEEEDSEQSENLLGEGRSFIKNNT